MKKEISREMKKDMIRDMSIAASAAQHTEEAKKAAELAEQKKTDWKNPSKNFSPEDFYPPVVVGTPLDKETHDDLPIVKGVPEAAK